MDVFGLRDNLISDYSSYVRSFIPERPKKEGRPAAVVQRLHRGLRTPETAFRTPILEALAELGGSAPVNEVLERVHGKVKSHLNEYDQQSLPSDPSEPRWRNTAQWCRLLLVHEGLLAADSPRGIWEITELGRKELARLSQPDDDAKQQLE